MRHSRTEYRATYKCRLCGETFQNDAIMKEAVAQVTTFELATVGNTQNIKCNGNFHKHAIHYCNDGSFGFADFQGFKKINKE